MGIICEARRLHKEIYLAVSLFAGVKIKGIFGRNELFLLPNYCLLMKICFRSLLLVTVFLFISLHLRAQQRLNIQERSPNPVFQKIDQAYREGKLSLDQKVRYKIYAGKAPQKLPAEFKSKNTLPLKCGTPAVTDFYRNKNQLSAATVTEIESELKPGHIQGSQTYQSPGGKFLVHYETSGSDAVPSNDADNDGIPDYVEEVAAAADSSYRHEVGTLGYPDPIPSGGTYDVEILNLQYLYGQTYTANGTTRIQIENDFSEGFPSNTDPEGDQIGAIKVTMAHEFKHAINYVINHWSGEPTHWGEMDATLEEELVYDNVNDYYNYLRNSGSIFISPQNSFYPGSYYHVTWALFFEQTYGSQFWPEVWQIIGSNPNISMVEAMSQQLGGRAKFDRAYIQSELWHYASGTKNSIGDFGFEEKENYPNSAINGRFTGIDSLKTPIDIPAFAAHYIELEPGIQGEGAVNVNFSFSGHFTGMGLIAEFRDGTYDVLTKLGEGNLKPQTIKTNWEWSKIKRIGIIATNSSDQSSSEYIAKAYPSIPDRITLKQNYPNPFNPGTTIQFTLTDETKVQLRVYDIAGRLVKTLRDEKLPAGYYQVPFDGSDIASGVYIYQLVTDQEKISKKMTLIK
ncbi:MAG: T9SS type A sorting domain-containing protein [Balneolaceae bacterium]|jgi:hypothetical protein